MSKIIEGVIVLALTAVVGFFIWKGDWSGTTVQVPTAITASEKALSDKAANAARYNAEYLARRNMDKIEPEYLKVDLVESYVTPDCPMGRGWAEITVSWTFDTVHWESAQQWCTVNDIEGRCYSREELKHKFPPEWFDSKQAKHIGGWLACDRELKTVAMFE